MKKILLTILALSPLALAAPAFAADLMVASTMQRCTTNEECQLVTNSCADNCAYVPVNKSNMTALSGLYQSRCGKPMEANPQCNMNPPLKAACINSRCTIDYPYANNAGAQDYKAGAYAAPEQAVPSKVPGDYSKVNDRNGQFSAYNLPQEDVKQNTVGQIITKIYVPPSAPVSGGNYVPVGPAVAAPVPAQKAVPAPAPTPRAAAPAPAVIPPAAVPYPQTNATPPVAVPAPQAAAPMAQPRPAPVPAPVPLAQQKPYEYVAPETPPVAPQAATAPKQVPSFAGVPRAPSIPAVGATGAPIAPPGSVPIPPSDLKPAPTFVPPTGAAVPVSPEDPGAPPPPGTELIPPNKDGVMGTTNTTGTKSFSGVPAKKSTYNAN